MTRVASRLSPLNDRTGPDVPCPIGLSHAHIRGYTVYSPYTIQPFTPIFLDSTASPTHVRSTQHDNRHANAAAQYLLWTRAHPKYAQTTTSSMMMILAARTVKLASFTGSHTSRWALRSAR